METFVHEDSPLADYLEGSGEAKPDWIPQDTTEPPSDTPDSSPVNFAPIGASKFRDRIRNKLPAPLRLKHSNKREALAQIQEACVAAITAKIGKKDNAKFLEQFGYIVVASQLLNEPTPPAYTSIAGVVAENTNAGTDRTTFRPAAYDLYGALFSAFASFFIVWMFRSLRPRQGVGWSPRKFTIFAVFLVAVIFGFYFFARRQWLRYIRQQALDVATVFVGNSQNFDTVAAASVLLIQEVELVSRGYRLSTPMPPVSRIEEQNQARRCLKLRRILSNCMSEILGKYLEAKSKLRHYADATNLGRYYDIYDFSPEELDEAQLSLADSGPEDKTSLKSLRLLFSQLYTVRKSLLCCLLALPADGSLLDSRRWNDAIEEMQSLAALSGSHIQRLTDMLQEQDRDIIASSPGPKVSPDTRERHRAQLRRLNSLSQGLRSVHAKMHLIREELDVCLEKRGEDSELNSTILAQYESIGGDLRGLLQEWEAGKSTLIANMGRPDRFSRPASMLKSPMSPTFSISGATAVDGSPDAALRALNGEDESDASNPDQHLVDEEVFEAVALPRKRNSMTREQRIARVKEDRAKQAAARDRADANTRMLRELETVIKFRPRGRDGPRVTSI